MAEWLLAERIPVAHRTRREDATAAPAPCIVDPWRTAGQLCFRPRGCTAFKCRLLRALIVSQLPALQRKGLLLHVVSPLSCYLFHFQADVDQPTRGNP